MQLHTELIQTEPEVSQIYQRRQRHYAKTSSKSLRKQTLMGCCKSRRPEVFLKFDISCLESFKKSLRKNPSSNSVMKKYMSAIGNFPNLENCCTLWSLSDCPFSMHTLRFAYHAIRNVRFSENFAYVQN